MAPLDTGYVTHTLRLVDTDGHKIGLSADDYQTLGAYLRAVRERRGQSIVDLATSTRIRRVYLVAIEDGDRSALPSRPFAIGYVRAYARALGLDGELAVARFKLDWPEETAPLRNPVGVEHDDQAEDARKPLIWAGVAVVVVALGLWNIAQRTLISDQPSTSGLDSVLADQPLKPPPEVVQLKAPEPPPQESTLPPPYVTPGLAAATGTDPAAAAPADGLQPAAYADPPIFTPRGAVYGAPHGLVVFQAKKPGSLVVRGPDKTVYFARQLAGGEAFRAQTGRGLSVEMVDPAAFVLYVGGQLKGPAVSPVIEIDKLQPAAPVTAVGHAASAAAPAAAPASPVSPG